jgi:hypothetical protein
LQISGKFHLMEFFKLIQIIKVMTGFLAFAHINGCLYWAIGSKDCPSHDPTCQDRESYDYLELSAAGDIRASWISWGGYQYLSPSQQYLASVYFSLATLTTVGYGDIAPQNDIERVFVLYMFVLGSLVYACVFGFVTTTVQNMTANAVSSCACMPGNCCNLPNRCSPLWAFLHRSYFDCG